MHSYAHMYDTYTHRHTFICHMHIEHTQHTNNSHTHEHAYTCTHTRIRTCTRTHTHTHAHALIVFCVVIIHAQNNTGFVPQNTTNTAFTPQKLRMVTVLQPFHRTVPAPFTLFAQTRISSKPHMRRKKRRGIKRMCVRTVRTFREV